MLSKMRLNDFYCRVNDMSTNLVPFRLPETVPINSPCQPKESIKCDKVGESRPLAKKFNDLCDRTIFDIVGEVDNVINPDGSLTTRVYITLPNRTNALLRGLTLVLIHHRVYDGIIDQILQQIKSYLNSSDNELCWLRRCKYLLTFPLSKYLRNESPPLPDKIFEFTGSARRFIKNRLNAYNSRNTHLWYSWLQCKRCTIPLSEDVILKNYKEHFATLTSPDPGVQSTIDSIFSNGPFISLLTEVRDSISENYLNKKNNSYDYSASTSACFENRRSDYGQAGCLLETSGVVGYALCSSELHSMKYHPRQEVFMDTGVQKTKPRTNYCHEIRIRPGFEEWREMCDNYEFNPTKPLKCIIQAILEPNKVRIISKGESLPYYSMKPLQKVIHNVMRRMDCFRLIGRPFCSTDCYDLVKRALPTWEWFSIDYSAATDGLSFNYSGRIFDFITSGLPFEDRLLASQVLGLHELYYPVDKGFQNLSIHIPEKMGMMTNGQLMGSILSFPVLCLANYGVYVEATKSIHEGWSDDEIKSHVLINGDDMVYAAPESLWGIQNRVGNDVGLKASVGKAYIHPIYLNINSTSVEYDLRKLRSKVFDYTLRTTIPRPIVFLNVGLFFGVHKVQGGSDVDEKDSNVLTLPYDERNSKPENYLGKRRSFNLIVNLNEVLQGSIQSFSRVSEDLSTKTNRYLIDLLRMYLIYHKEKIADDTRIQYKKETYSGYKKHCFHYRNLFLPISRGGMGIIPPQGFKFKTTKTDRSIAENIQNRFSGSTHMSKPLPGYEYETPLNLAFCPWSKVDNMVPSSLEVDLFKWDHLGMIYNRGFGSVNFSTKSCKRAVYFSLPQRFASEVDYNLYKSC
jgi:hypothetical protein